MTSINKIALITSLFFYAHTVNSQGYTPMLNQLNEWHFTTCFSGCLTDIYWTDGDTIVGGKTYKILDGFHYISRSFLIREDVQNRKVYMLINNPPAHNFEKLLYDFSIQVGDTMAMSNPISPYPENPGKFICDSIVMRTLVDSNDYRHFYFHPIDSVQASSNFAVWVEGVGSLSLINAPGGEPDLNNVGHLTCFFKEGVNFYQKFEGHPVCQSTILPNSVEKVDYFKPNVSHHTNAKTLQISTSRFPYDLKMIDIHGRQIGNTVHVTSDKCTIDYSSFAAGLMLIQLTDKNGNYSVIKSVIPN